MSNIEKYLKLASDCNSPYGNGLTYKNDDAFAHHNDEICYISENALDDLEEMFENGYDLTDAQLIEQGYAESYNSIIKQVVDADLDEKTDNAVHDIAEYIYQNADWAYISTYILEFDEISFF